MFDFSQLMETRTANAVAQTDDADGTRVGTNGVGNLVAAPAAMMMFVQLQLLWGRQVIAYKVKN